ncbi:MAG: hypothetical protein IIC75_03715 [Bacteroidetes bacterium]|nr:hypothetical protein [Bacteroidota bacterium]
MKRTQIYIDEDLMQILKIQSKLKSKTVSEIIRNVLKEKFLKRRQRKQFFSNAVGLWKSKKFDVDVYVRNIRKGNRLKDLYAK